MSSETSTGLSEQASACRLILSDALQLALPSGIVPTAVLPEGLDPIQDEPRRMSLVSRRGMRAVRGAFEHLDLSAFIPPLPVFGAPRLVVRTGKEGHASMACVVSRVENHAEFKAFVARVFEAAGVPNPEKRFVYHLTLGNNAGGHPWGSIAYINPSDFQGEPLSMDRVFDQRPIDPSWPAMSTTRAGRGPSLR